MRDERGGGERERTADEAGEDGEDGAGAEDVALTPHWSDERGREMDISWKESREDSERARQRQRQRERGEIEERQEEEQEAKRSIEEWEEFAKRIEDQVRRQSEGE